MFKSFGTKNLYLATPNWKLSISNWKLTQRSFKILITWLIYVQYYNLLVWCLGPTIKSLRLWILRVVMLHWHLNDCLSAFFFFLCVFFVRVAIRVHGSGLCRVEPWVFGYMDWPEPDLFSKRVRNPL